MNDEMVHKQQLLESMHHNNNNNNNSKKSKQNLVMCKTEKTAKQTIERMEICVLIEFMFLSVVLCSQLYAPVAVDRCHF
jgi:hypothetical protein